MLFRLKIMKSARLRNINSPIIYRTFYELVALHFPLSKVLFPNLVSKNSDK